VSSYSNLNPITIDYIYIKIYTAQLIKENDLLQTAWWFDNGKHKTHSQLEWRWKSILGATPYRLINITTETKDQLKNEIGSLINKDLCSKE